MRPFYRVCSLPEMFSSLATEPAKPTERNLPDALGGLCGQSLLVLLVGQLLHVLLEDLLVLRGEIVERALAGEHRFAEARREVSPVAGAVGVAPELVDRLAVAARIVGLFRGIARLGRTLRGPRLRLRLSLLRRSRPGPVAAGAAAFAAGLQL